jgi:hypothetical protein
MSSVDGCEYRYMGLGFGQIGRAEGEMGIDQMRGLIGKRAVESTKEMMLIHVRGCTIIARCI